MLGVCGMTAIGLSLYRVKSAINDPFLVDRSEIVAAKNIVGQTPEEKEALQKRTDTDGDGLSDWDEENVYRTNPNLRDTCGDGQPDNVRVATGKNLNCQSGHPSGGSPALFNPGTATSGTSDGSAALQQLYPGLNAPALFGSQTIPTSTGPLGQQAAQFEQILPRDPAAIRAALSGKVDPSKLSALSDEQLLEYYDQAIAIQGGNDGSPTATSGTPGTQ